MSFVKFEMQGEIGIATIDRQEALNALNGEVIGELEELVTKLENDTEIRALILTGAGRSFVAGADIKLQQPLDVDGGRRWGQRGSKVFRRLEKLEIPTIAAVNGFALGGGCELAMSCDIILASEKAKFGQPEVGLGIAKAKELIYSGKMIKADEAKAIGLVNEVYAPEELMDKAIEMAKSFTKNAPIAVKYAKALIDRGMQMDIDDGIMLEQEMFAMCFATKDQKEGMSAFIEKRPAEFKNC